jgi:hypothetical protein
LGAGEDHHVDDCCDCVSGGGSFLKL